MNKASNRRKICDRVMRAAIVETMMYARAREWSDREADYGYSVQVQAGIVGRNVLEAGIKMANDHCARHLVDGELGLAHASARVAADLRASLGRLLERQVAR